MTDERDYPCVAKRPDGTVDYWAVEDEGSAIANDELARTLVDEVCAIAAGESGAPDLDGLDAALFILLAAVRAADNRDHPGAGVADAYVRAFIERAVTREPATSLRLQDATPDTNAAL
jgi:hypothetical protein